MPRPDNGISGQGIDLFLNRSQQCLHGPAGKVGSAHGPNKQGIPGKYIAFRIQTNPTRRLAQKIEKDNKLKKTIDRLEKQINVSRMKT